MIGNCKIVFDVDSRTYTEPLDCVDGNCNCSSINGEPTTYEQALDIVLAEMREIMLDRHRKYGAQNILRGGVHGLIIRIGDKLARIEKDHEDCSFKGLCDLRDLPDEAGEDAWLDLSNYAGPVGLMLQRGWWELPLDG